MQWEGRFIGYSLFKYLHVANSVTFEVSILQRNKNIPPTSRFYCYTGWFRIRFVLTKCTIGLAIYT